MSRLGSVVDINLSSMGMKPSLVYAVICGLKLEYLNHADDAADLVSKFHFFVNRTDTRLGAIPIDTVSF